MDKEIRESLADWMIVLGAVTLFVSLFLAWSHQFSPGFYALFGSAAILHDVPRDPTAWQVYSAVDVLLALLALSLLLAAMFGSRRVRLGALAGAGVGLAFTLHALSDPPTNGVNIFNPSLSVPDYLPTGATAGIGETVAIIGLLVGIAGLLLSFTAD